MTTKADATLDSQVHFYATRVVWDDKELIGDAYQYHEKKEQAEKFVAGYNEHNSTHPSTAEMDGERMFTVFAIGERFQLVPECRPLPSYFALRKA